MEVKWDKCPYHGDVCGRLSQGYSCLVGGSHATVRTLKSICGLDDETIQRLIDEGLAEAPYKPKPR